MCMKKGEPKKPSYGPCRETHGQLSYTHSYTAASNISSSNGMLYSSADNYTGTASDMTYNIFTDAGTDTRYYTVPVYRI